MAQFLAPRNPVQGRLLQAAQKVTNMPVGTARPAGSAISTQPVSNMPVRKSPRWGAGKPGLRKSKGNLQLAARRKLMASRKTSN
jgi:hypothetical protein